MRTPTFDLRLLRPFAVLGEELHFGRAAKRLAMNQPALSQQIAKLEAQLDTRLLTRSNHGASLTPAGERFLVEARELLGRISRAEVDVRSATSGELSVHLGDAANPLVRHTLATFVAAHPKIAVHVTEGKLSDATLSVRDERADIGFDMPDAVPTGLRYTRLDRQPLGVACAATDRLARRPHASWTDLQGEVLFMAAPGVADGYNLLVRSALRRRGIECIEKSLGVPRGAYLAGYIAAGVGALITAAYVLQPLPAGVAWVPLRPSVSVEIGAVWRPGAPDETVGRFVRWVDRHAGALASGPGEGR